MSDENDQVTRDLLEVNNLLNSKIDELVLRVSILEAERDKSTLQRMSYLTWAIANPLTLVFLPTIFSIAVELCINNWGSTYTE